MAGTIRRTVRNDNLPKIEKSIKELKRNVLRIGIFGETGSDILMIATVNEYGVSINVTDKMRRYLSSQGLHLKGSTTTITIPERSFIRGSYDNNKSNINRFVTLWLDKTLTGEITVKQFYKKVGEKLVSIVKRYMTDLKRPANHPFTLQQKAPKDNPLINTGNLRRSVVWKVERR